MWAFPHQLLKFQAGFSSLLPLNLNAERDAPNFLRKASLGLKLHFSFSFASKRGKEKPVNKKGV